MYRHVFDITIRIPKKLAGVEVMRFGGRYPAETRAYNKFRKEKNTLPVGTGALLHLVRAAERGISQTSCFVTVTGDALANPRNVEVPVGTPVSEMLRFCGLAADPETVIVGGSMTGRSISDPEEEKVGVMTRGVLAFRESYKSLAISASAAGAATMPARRPLRSQLRRLPNSAAGIFWNFTTWTAASAAFLLVCLPVEAGYRYHDFCRQAQPCRRKGACRERGAAE